MEFDWLPSLHLVLGDRSYLVSWKQPSRAAGRAAAHTSLLTQAGLPAHPTSLDRLSWEYTPLEAAVCVWVCAAALSAAQCFQSVDSLCRSASFTGTCQTAVNGNRRPEDDISTDSILSAAWLAMLKESQSALKDHTDVSTWGCKPGMRPH